MASGLLLTGATGLVGGGLLAQLLATRPSLRVTAIARRPGALPRHPRVRVVQGDVTRAGLGLDPQLRASLTEVIHCAADTRFNVSLEQARAANVSGTAHVLELARGCPRLEKFVHVSTAYVAGRRTGRLREARVEASEGFSSVYQQSKHEAEELVFGSMDELPASIYRLSTIIGDAETGRVRRFNYVHQLLRLLPKNLLPMVPGDLSAPIDLIPFEWTIKALAVLSDRFVPGRVYQVCAGPRESLSVGELCDLTLRAHHRHGVGPIEAPTIVSLEEYEAFLEQSLRGRDVLLKGVLKALGGVLPHLALHQAFDNGHVVEGLAASGVSLPPVRDYYDRILDYCLATDWGRRPAHYVRDPISLPDEARRSSCGSPP